MKIKRIVLHIVILALAVCSAWQLMNALVADEKRYMGLTVSEAEEQYSDMYLNDVEEVICTVYMQMSGEFPIDGYEKPVAFNDVVIPTKVWLNEGFVWSVTNGKKTITNEKKKPLVSYENECILDKDGVKFVKSAENDDFVMNTVLKDMGQKSEVEYWSDDEEWNIPFEELKKFFGKNNIQFRFKIKKDLARNTNYGEMKEYIQKGFTNEERQKDIRFMMQSLIASIVLALLILIPFIWLMVIAGHEKKGDEVHLFKIDRVWIDVVTGMFGIGLIIFLSDMENYFLFVRNDGEGLWTFCGWLAIGVVFLEIFVQLCESAVRRWKCKSFCRTTLVGRIVILLRNISKKIYKNLRITAKVVLWGIIALVVMGMDFILALASENVLLAAIIIAMPIAAAAVFLWIYFKEKEIVMDGVKRIADGDVTYKIADNMRFASNKKLSEDINSIGEGLEVAVQSSVKNERMKTELITNVSHDLKTPLTSIINYVDLLKTDGLDSEKAPEYLDILDRKSQRLKTLTEDLVEASKLNSGVIELQCEKIDIVQLVNQSLAEYEERFVASRLELIKNFKNQKIYVHADGRKTWRALDNLYSNVCKYAMANTRVYIDIERNGGMVVVSIKNISAGKLNFNGEELMERFVRGDVSRTTEGSGLGLSIAKSIMERQEGRLDIVLDGDLFKVQLSLKRVSTVFENVPKKV